MRNLAYAALIPLACSLPALARAADPCDVSINNACIDSDGFWAHAGASRFTSVGGTEALPASQLSFGLISSYQSRPVTLVNPSPGPTGTKSVAVDNQLTEHFLFAYGITDRLSASFVLPATIAQNGEGLRPITGGDRLRSQALRDLRFGLAFSLLDRTMAPREGGAQVHVDDATWAAHRPISYGLMARLEVAAPTGDRDAFATNGTAVFWPSLAGDVRIRRLTLATEVGVRVREVRESFGTRQGSQLAQAIGVSYDIWGNEVLSPFAEFRYLLGMASNRQSALLADGTLASSAVSGGMAPAEWLVGARTGGLFGGDFSIDLSGGGGVPLTGDDFGTPRFRFTLGLRYAPKNRDSDGDGIRDAVDKCPHTYAARSADPDAPVDGCEHAAKPLDFSESSEAAPAPAPNRQPWPVQRGDGTSTAPLGR